MSTFIGQLIGFTIIVWLVWRFVVPPLGRMMAEQQQSIRSQLEEAAAAGERLVEADQAHAKAVTDAQVEAERVTDEARTDAERITGQLRVQAEADSDRIRVQGGQQMDLLRAQTIRQLRSDLGAESVRRAAELIRDHVADPARQSATVDRFLDELDAMAPSPVDIENPVSANMRSASRDALDSLFEQFTGLADGLDGPGLASLAEDLTAVAGLLVNETLLARYLTVSTDDAAPRVRLAERLLTGKVCEPALQLTKSAVSSRWSVEADLITAIEQIARQALLLRAERDGQADEVEDQLFRFSRILDAQPRLDTLLGDDTTPAGGRVRLLRNVIDRAGANQTAVALLSQTVELLRGRPAHQAAAELARIAVARRGEVVAHVGAAAQLSDPQRSRLNTVLSRIYSHPVRVHAHVDPELLGGLTISVGDEVIDGSLASRLAAAKAQLPD